MSDQDTKKNQIQKIGSQAAANAREKLLTALEDKGINSDALSALSRELLCATTTKTYFDSKTKQIVYSKPLIDNTTRFNMLKLMLEFKDAMPSKKVDISDNRQLRQFAGIIFEKMEKLGQTGIEDKTMPSEIQDAEFELLSHNLEQKSEKEDNE